MNAIQRHLHKICNFPQKRYNASPYSHFGGRMVLRAGIFGAVILWAASAFGQWQWSAPASYHDAIVRVSIDGQQGSGALICSDPGIVATAKHVVSRGEYASPEQSARIAWANGYVATGELFGSGNQTDLAFYRVSVPQDAAIVPLADEMPSAGQTVEICGYGGPTKQLRHFQGPVLASDADSLKVDAYVISGDSGGAILHDGRLVAINWGGSTTTAYVGEDGNSWPLVYPATGWGLGPIRRILTQCQDCPPQQQPRVMGGVIGFGRIRYIEPQQPPRGPTAPPISSPPANELTPVAPSPPKQPAPAAVLADIDGIRRRLDASIVQIDAINARIDSLVSVQASPRELSEAEVSQIVDRLIVSIQGNPAFRGERGEKGDPGPAGSPANLDMAKVTAEVIAKLPPVVMEIHNQGRVSRQSAPLGKPIAIGQKDRTKK